jgi:RHH-type proline utilization regulon transcriptional repressor/proline dehydrogenase/delta 1-pyrroline-5-carboxylate dehydrogenase
VIDADAKAILVAHAARMSPKRSSSPKQSSAPKRTPSTAPSSRRRAWELQSLPNSTARSSARPCTWCAGRPINSMPWSMQINATGYGLTLGIHSRIDATIDRIVSRAKVGNIYVNRNQIGAVVGVQPFGGQGLSGTGPKAGGPHYLPRFATEKTVTVNTTAAGGNASLLTLGD